MSRELRRFGGWSWLRDDGLSLDDAKNFLSFGADFLFDCVFSPAAEHALLTGDADLARFMADEALRLNIDFRRLVHVMPAQDGINYSLSHLRRLEDGGGGEKAEMFRFSLQNSMRVVANRLSPSPLQGSRLYSSGPGLAALALGLTTLKEARDKLADVERGHSLLIFFKAMQPGVMMLAGQDLAGVLPLPFDGTVKASPGFSPADSGRGGYGLTMSSGSLAISTQGTPRAPQLYLSPDSQVHQQNSFLSRIGAFLRARTEHGIAKATLTARPATKGKGSIALLSHMPDGKRFLLSVCNFSREKVTETISLADVPGIDAAMTSKAVVIATGGSHRISGTNVTVTLEPWQGRALLLRGRSGKGEKTSGSAPAVEKTTPIP
jgi:hypothetical protein